MKCSQCTSTSCHCPPAPASRPLGLRIDDCDAVIALAGNPNTGKSTVFNRLTGLHQHTGNWPGKTIARAEGAFSYAGKSYRLVDLPGTYSLLSASPDAALRDCWKQSARFIRWPRCRHPSAPIF